MDKQYTHPEKSRLHQWLVITFLPATIVASLVYFVVIEPLIDAAAGFLIEWIQQESDIDGEWQ